MEVTIRINDQEYHVAKSKLRIWLQLEETRSRILEAAGTRDNDRLVSDIISYVSVASLVSKEILGDASGWEVIGSFLIIHDLNLPKLDFPILKAKIKDDKDAWDYEGRIWYIWSHIFASKYGWSLEYSANLEVDDAVALIQEAIIEDQLTKEWQWSLAEIAYQYDQFTKTSKFIPLPRPDWMNASIPLQQVIKKVKILKSMIPVGNVVRWDENSGKIITAQPTDESL